MHPQFIPLPPKAKNITNQRFGRLVALGPIGRIHPKGNFIWLCQCDCENKTSVRGAHLLNGAIRSCGCLRSETTTNRSTTHGMTKEPIHAVWQTMIQRCTNPNNKDYKYYGGRGIQVCREWQESFIAFYDHVSELTNYSEKGYSIDRIDNSLGYSPSNVRWATVAKQATNKRLRRDARILTLNGKTQSLAAWAKEVGLSIQLISYRLSHGWSIERSLITPARG